MTAAGGLPPANTPYVAALLRPFMEYIMTLPLYNDLAKFSRDELARRFNVVAQTSIEDGRHIPARAFLTVKRHHGQPVRPCWDANRPPLGRFSTDSTSKLQTSTTKYE